MGITHRIHCAAIYGNIYHQYTPVMLAYIYHTWILWVILYIIYIIIFKSLGIVVYSKQNSFQISSMGVK